MLSLTLNMMEELLKTESQGTCIQSNVRDTELSSERGLQERCRVAVTMAKREAHQISGISTSALRRFYSERMKGGGMISEPLPWPLKREEIVETPGLSNYGAGNTFGGYYIPSCAKMFLSDPLTDYYNPAYMPSEYMTRTTGEEPPRNVPHLEEIGYRRELRTVHLRGLVRNDRMNKYLHKIWKYLLNVRERDPQKYWEVVSRVLGSSKGILLVSLCAVEPHWFKSMDSRRVLKLLKKVRKEWIQEDRREYTVREVLIPKDDGTQRSLSVPSLEARLYLYLINLFLSTFADPHLNEHQHGHRKGKGLGSAWSDLIHNGMLNKKYILEFDYKAFHPSVPYKLIRQGLKRIRVPSSWIERIIELNNPWIQDAEAELDAQGNPTVYKRNNGVPQGVAIAAILGILCLEELKVYEIPGYVGYADDGVICSDHNPLPELQSRLAGSGIELKPAKTALVVEDGVWKRPLKFLGCELEVLGENYSQDGATFHARTRKGSTSPFAVVENDGQNSLSWHQVDRKVDLDIVLGKTFCQNAKLPNWTTLLSTREETQKVESEWGQGHRIIHFQPGEMSWKSLGNYVQQRVKTSGVTLSSYCMNELMRRWDNSPGAQTARPQASKYGGRLS
jgi:hypothetical protein